MEEIQVKFVASGGNQLSGILTKPISSTGANENKVVVLVHGGMAHKNSFYHPSLAYSLATEEGFTVFRYDALSAGESRPICKEMCTEQYRNMMSGFWENLEDLRVACEYLQNSHGLRVAVVIGHSYGGQISHMFAHRYGTQFGLEGVAGVHMRFDLEYWRQTFLKKGGEWKLAFKNRGQPVEHNVTREDVDVYASVPMRDVANIKCPVLNVYGILGQQTNQASYDTGTELLTDGVVPFSDVEYPANLCANHTLRFLHGVGHFYREEGSKEKLWEVVKEWLSGLPPKFSPRL